MDPTPTLRDNFTTEQKIEASKQAFLFFNTKQVSAPPLLKFSKLS